MSKKDRRRGQPDVVLTGPDASGQPVSTEIPAQETGRPDPSGKYFLILWVVIFLAAATAWILAIVWPGVSESIFERWMMAALAVSLAAFLFFYK